MDRQNTNISKSEISYKSLKRALTKTTMKLNKSVTTPQKSAVKKLRIAIVLPRFNDELGSELLANTENQLATLGVEKVDIYRVPGALELPYAALKIAKGKRHSAIITLGIVIRGETKHFDLVAEESHRGLMKVSLEQNIPVVFGILATENEKQAIDRVRADRMNKGKEFADTAVEMALFHV